MIDRTHDLSIAKQAEALGISRGSVYYLPRSVPAADLAIMRRMDELHLELPFAGSRMLRDLLNQEGIDIGRRHVSTLMKRIGLEALYRKPNTSKPAPGHKIYPYLLRGMTIDRPNQVWAMDITYVPMARGFASVSPASRNKAATLAVRSSALSGGRLLRLYDLLSFSGVPLIPGARDRAVWQGGLAYPAFSGGGGQPHHRAEMEVATLW